MRTFDPDTKKAASGFVLAVVIVSSAALVASVAKADEPCKSGADLRNLSDIKQNQETVAENHESHDRLKQAVLSDQQINEDDVDGYNDFTEAKSWNTSEVAELSANGCTVDWSTMTLVPFVSRP